MRVALLAALATGANAALAPSDIKDIVVFGDSVSDTGNLYALYGVPLPPYKDGRFSNGPVWVEFLSKYLNGASLHDFAYGSSCADVADSQNMPLFQGSSVTTAQIPDLMGQLALFKKDSASKLNSKSTLFTVFAGGNDFNFSARAGKIPNPKTIADAVINMVQALLKEGVTNVLVGNMPPLDKTPSGYSNPSLQPILAYLSDSFNTALAEGIAKIAASNPSADIVVNDINRLFTYATTPAGQKDFGIVDYSHTCFNQTAWVACAHPNTYLFWDGVHPTSTGHDHLAQWSYNQLFNISGFDAPADVVNASASSSSAVSSSTTTISRIASMTTFAPVSTLPITSTFVATLQTSVVVPSSTIPLPSSASPFPTPTTAIYAVPVPPNYVPSPVASYVPASVQSPPVASYVPASVSVAPVATNLYSGTGRVTMVIGMTVFGALFAF